MMAARVTRRRKAVLSGGLHPHYAEAAHTLAHSAGVETRRLAAAVDAEAAVIDAIDADTACVVVQTPNVFGTVTDVTAIAEAAHAAGALLIVVTTEAVSFGLLKSPGEMGADIAVAEGQSIGNAPELRRALRRPVRLPREVGAADAGPALRRDRGRRGPARLRADPVDPRAAHPPREGDVEHLHQLGPLRPGLLHPHDPAGRGRACASWRRSTTAGRGSWRRRLAGARRRGPDPALLQRDRGAPEGQRRRWSRTWPGDGILAGVPFSRLDPEPGWTTCCWSAPPRPPAGRHRRPGGGADAEVVGMTMVKRRPPHPPRRRPPTAAAIPASALLQDEPLIFELGGWDKTGVDLPAEPRPRRLRSGRPGPRRADRPARPLRAGDPAPLCAPVPEEPRHRPGALSAGLVHHEAQPAPQREDGPPGRASPTSTRCSRSPPSRAPWR